MAQSNTNSVSPLGLQATLERSCIFILGLILALLPLVFWSATQDQFELPKLVVLRLLSVTLVGLYAASLSLSPRWIFRRTPVDLPMLAWSLWLAFKTLNSVSPSISWRGEYENFAGSLTQLNYSLLFFVTVQCVRNLSSARALLLTLEASALAAGVYAIFQALQLDFIAWASNSIITDRYFSSLGNPNFLGALLIMALALLVARAFWSQIRPTGAKLWAHWGFMLLIPLVWLTLYSFFPLPQGHNLDFAQIRATGQAGAQATLTLYVFGLAAAAFLIWRKRAPLAIWLLYGLEALVLLKALADTGTRGAFAGLLAMVAFFVFLALRRLWRIQSANGVGSTRRTLNLAGAGFGLVVALGILSLLFGSGLRQRMAHTLLHPLQAFDESRMQIWIPAVHIARDFPLTGTGVDTFKSVFPQYSYSKFAKYDGDNVASRMAHCEPLQILSTLGLIGLILWCWLLFSWGRCWLRLWRDKQTDADLEKRALLAGLAGLVLAYLVQNLVSFGVSSISAPFFICLGLLGSAGGFSEKGKNRPGYAPWLLVPLLGLLSWGAWSTFATFRADEFYSFGHLVSSQLPILANAPAAEARSAAAYALHELQEEAENLDPQAKEEINAAYERLQQAESKGPGTLESEALYREASQNLLLILSAERQARAVALAPDEVKYHVYLGLAYEELYKRSGDQAQKQHWFEKAEKQYSEGVRLNPRNAYYRGNLGRLTTLRAQAPAPDFIPKAEEYYIQAIGLAPVTKLFYENLIELYARYGEPEKCFPLLEPLERRDPELASQIYLEASNMFSQYSGFFQAQKQKTMAASLKAASERALVKARTLEAMKS